MIMKRHRWIAQVAIPLLAAGLLVPAGAVGASADPTADSVAAVAAAPSAAGQVADITAAEQVDRHTVTFTAGAGALRVTATTNATLHVEFAQDGTFTDPNSAPSDPTAPDEPMIKDPAAPSGTLKLATTATGYRLSTPDASLTVTRSAPKLTLRNAAGSVLFAEASPLSWTEAGTTQTLTPKPGEQFFGGGEQNGAYNHTGKTINVANSFNWNEGGYNNSQPYYVSTAGYGVFRNTFAPGSYTFADGAAGIGGAPTTTTENEQRFDAYYFVGDMKTVIGAYTSLVGKPFLPPIYGLELGDSDCYLHNANRGERHTLDALDIAQGYVDNGMPNGWMLVNDGYGCGYENLAETGDGLQQRNMALGLWTQDGLANIADETAAGVKVRKLDVAWVGPGYRFALDGCQSAYDGIQNGSDARGFVYQPNSWAGAQRCGVLWSGDQSGSWDYIRWQIPTYASSTVSGIAYNTGDVDGIYGGSPKTYVRDLQWKAMLPTTMTMDGWSGYDKQPWRYGEEYNAINRKYLLLKERLLPYSYSYSAQAHATGVGQVRPLYLEYPNDPVAASDAAKYEFLSGDDFLVAPVYSDTSVRNGIYLPKGTWVDYWTHRTYTGPTTINGYHAPLDTLPLFVKAGAVVPMWPEGTTSWQTRDKTQLDVDIYPQGRSSFSLYEDDGVTRQYAAGKSSTQQISVAAPTAGNGKITVTLGKIDGRYTGQVDNRAYNLAVHSPVQPKNVKAGKKKLDQVADADALAGVATGWYYDGGIAHIKTPAVARNAALDVVISGGASVVSKKNDSAGAVSFTAPAMATPGSTSEVQVTFRNDTDAVVTGLRLSLTSDNAGVTGTPAEVPVRTTIEPGASATVPITVTVAADATPGTAVLTASARYTARGASYLGDFSAETVVPYPNVAAALDNNGVTDLAGSADGRWDGSGAGAGSFVSEQLVAAGLTPGASVTAGSLSYTWPDVAPAADDNIAAAGQTIAVSGRGNALGILGSGSSTVASGPVTVTYTDGSTSTGTVGLTNWCCVATAFGNTKVASSKGKYISGQAGVQYPTVDYSVFSTTLRISPTKEVAAVTLPSNSAMHVFAVSVGSTALPPPPPAGDSWVSDLTEISSSNGYGPVEKDQSNGENRANDGNPITLGGVVHAKGLGTHAPSTVSYNLSGRCTKFTATVGIDDEIADYGSVIFTVRVDGVDKVISPVLTGSSAPVDLTADVSGADYLDLVVTPGASSISGDHADWGSAKLSCSA
ncbi:NPCBM/NEW2 domain-containing protein [Nakamurella lactea]|uniref:NPCBM/NEW2 domain-containing protein n=1 Tax=Nakamurella lactea TaxID=459515 RepID=UPI0003FA6A9C|nr:NPCBM/NEW2 domain-containing protein [Nakamurella lactea]